MKLVEVSGMQMLTIKPWERLRTKEMNPRSISSAKHNHRTTLDKKKIMCKVTIEESAPRPLS